MTIIYLAAIPMHSGSGRVHGSTPGGDVMGYALAQDGHCLCSHFSSSIGFAKHDMGLTSDWKHEHYKAHAPDGYTLIWIDDPETDARWIAAVALNKAHEQAAKLAAVDPGDDLGQKAATREKGI